MALTVSDTTIDEIQRDPAFGALVTEYAAESATVEIGTVAPDLAQYRQMVDAGVAHIFAVRIEGRLAGLAVLLVSSVPHFAGRLIASTESLFVTQWARGMGAGLELLAAVERRARSLGAVALFVSAPTGSRLADVLGRRKSYRESNRVFVRGLT